MPILLRGLAVAGERATMLTKLLTAAAAAGAISTASASAPAASSSNTVVHGAEERGYAGPRSERARIIGIANEVRHLVARFAGVAAGEVIATRELIELGVDDMALSDVVLGLEARFEIDIDYDAAKRWQNVGDIVAAVAVARSPRGAMPIAS
jgi:acyl carrier protein